METRGWDTVTETEQAQLFSDIAVSPPGRGSCLDIRKLQTKNEICPGDLEGWTKLRRVILGFLYNGKSSLGPAYPERRMY